MKNLKIISALFLLTLFAACGPKTETETNAENQVNEETGRVDVNKLNMKNLLAEIKVREKAFHEEKTVNNKNGYLLMEAYVAFSERFNNYENAAEYLFKAGEIAMGDNLTVESIRYLTRLYDDFPRYENRAYGLFLLAFVQENQAENLDEAKRLYGAFLDEFPSHEMADDARASIANLGKTPEQIIREFEVKDSIAKAQQS